MPTWANRAVFLLAMIVPIVVGLWLYSMVFAAPLGGRSRVDASETPSPATASSPVPSATASAEPTGAASLAALPLPTPTEVTVQATASPAPLATGTARATATATQARASTMMPTPASEPVTPAETAALGPVQTVQEFYRRIDQRELDSAAELWTPGMRARFPPDVNIRQRFTNTRSIRVDRAVLAQSSDLGVAVVEVEMLETRGSPPSSQNISGTWRLVRGDVGWQLDEPRLAVR